MDKSTAYPPAVTELRKEGQLPEDTTLRQCNYLNNIVEQDHRRVKGLTRPMLGFQSFHNAHRTLRGIQVLSMLRKGQVCDVPRSDIVAENAFIDQVFGLAA